MTTVKIPVELVDGILDCFAPALTPGRKRTPAVKFTHGQLATCSLVSKRWAKLCRRHLFRSILLRSAADLTHFLRLTKSAGPVVPPIIHCIDEVVVEADEPSPTPWIHRISILSIFRSADVSIRLGPGYLRDWKYADFLHSLPTQFPPSIFRGIKSLHISGYHFPDTGAFLRTLCGLRNLSTFGCTDSTCVETIVVPRTAISGLSPFTTVTLNNCSATIYLLRACTIAFCYRVEHDIGVPFDALYERAACLLATISTADKAYKSAPISLALTGTTVVLACYPAFEVKMDFGQALNGVVEVSFEVQDSSRLREVVCDWTALNDALSRSDTILDTVLSASYRQTVAWFSNLYQQTTDRFRRQNKAPAMAPAPSSEMTFESGDVEMLGDIQSLLAPQPPHLSFKEQRRRSLLRQTSGTIVQEYAKLHSAGEVGISEDTATTPTTSTPRYVDPRYTDSILSALLGRDGRALGRPTNPRRDALSSFRALQRWEASSYGETEPPTEEARHEYELAMEAFKGYHLSNIMKTDFGFLDDSTVQSGFPIFRIQPTGQGVTVDSWPVVRNHVSDRRNFAQLE